MKYFVLALLLMIACFMVSTSYADQPISSTTPGLIEVQVEYVVAPRHREWHWPWSKPTPVPTIAPAPVVVVPPVVVTPPAIVTAPTKPQCACNGPSSSGNYLEVGQPIRNTLKAQLPLRITRKVLKAGHRVIQGIRPRGGCCN